MVNFSKHLFGEEQSRPENPLEIYETLDRASDKGPLRPAQISVLETWFAECRKEKDVIIKLHTGQGKTLIGLLILQSQLNTKNGPGLYLCPNNYLVEQTCQQAKQFGFKYCIAEDDLPTEFLDAKSILITSVQKLFNGLSKFGIGPKSEEVGSIVLDDSHACLDAIRSCFTIKLQQGSVPYNELFSLFTDDLLAQGEGAYHDIKNKKAGEFLPVPYWAWQQRSAEVAAILSKSGSLKEIKFAWPLLKNILSDCLCLISGSHLEISPYQLPLSTFGSFTQATQRIFMSATVNNDSFFIKDLGVDPKAIKKPIRYVKEKWSGERMVLMPALIHDELSRETIVNKLGVPVPGRKFGVAALTSSFESAKLWEHVGAKVSKSDSIISDISDLKKGKYEKVVVFVNRYDGIDLPDDSCRILIIDSRPFSEELLDRHHEQCRGTSDVTDAKLSQKIEQGMGRNIRGEKDYGVVILTGPQLIKAIGTKKGRRFLSAQTRQQIELGTTIADIAKEDSTKDEPIKIITTLIQQCLSRDEGWKAFYKQNMDRMPDEDLHEKVLEIFIAEKRAEDMYRLGKVDQAVETIQKLIDSQDFSAEERSWYLQEMARYRHKSSPIEANKLQISAHRMNGYLLRPRDGMEIEKLDAIGQERAERIIAFVQSFESYEELIVRLDDILDALQFGVLPERFEKAMHDLGIAMGFPSQQPDRQWKSGPDNLWALRDGEYMLIECKNDVDRDRVEIHKDESGQMNNACAWFERNYPGARSLNIMITPARQLGTAAGFNKTVRLMRESKLRRLKINVRKFFQEFRKVDFSDLSVESVDFALKAHNLRVDSWDSEYTEPVRPPLK